VPFSRRAYSKFILVVYFFGVIVGVSDPRRSYTDY